MPVIIGALGTIKALGRNFQLLLGHPAAIERRSSR